MNYILNRLKEKSTLVAIFAVLGGVGITIGPELQQQLIGIVTAVVGFVLFGLKDKGSPDA